MKINVIQKPDSQISDFFEKRIYEFNVARWEIKEKIPLAITVEDEQENIIGGVFAKTFGLWLLIDNLWIREDQRGKNLGTKILENLEKAAIARGCKEALLDTLDFQARPFYEKHGYKVVWTQENYPKKGAKYFMTKKLLG